MTTGWTKKPRATPFFGSCIGPVFKTMSSRVIYCVDRAKKKKRNYLVLIC